MRINTLCHASITEIFNRTFIKIACRTASIVKYLIEPMLKLLD